MSSLAPPGGEGRGEGATYAAAVQMIANGDPAQALVLLDQCLDHRPDFHAARNALGLALLDLGRLEEGEAQLREVVEAEPDNVPALSNLGKALIQQNRPAEAEAVLRRALAFEPDNASTLNNLGMALENQGRIMEAVKVYRQAESGHEATLNLGRLLRSLGRAAEAVAVYDASPVADPEIAENRLFALLYDAKKSKEEVAKAHIEWGVGELNKNPHAEERSVSKHASNPKLGFLSPDLRTHSVAYFVLPVLEACAKLGIPTVCYSDTAVPDAMTARLKRAAGKWRDIAGKPDALVAEMIRADGLSALFDLAGHTAGGRMGVLARKPVPVQAGWIGYPHPSGLPTVDYFITDELCAPPGLDGLYAPEKLLRLPGPFSCYAPPADLPEPGPLPEGSTVFVSFNNMAKMSDAVVTTWAALLRRAPDSTLLLKSWQFADPDVRTETMARFAVHHVDPSRLRLVGNLPSAIQHLSLYGQAHVALDTFPYNGTTTTCEALWMGLPVVSLAGDSHLSRVGVSLLTHAGFPEWIAKTPESYVEIALDLAQDRTRLAGLRGGQMRARLTASALSDAMALVRGLIQRLS